MSEKRKTPDVTEVCPICDIEDCQHIRHKRAEERYDAWRWSEEHAEVLRKAGEALKNLDYLLEAESTPTKRRLADARRDARAVLREMEGEV